MDTNGTNFEHLKELLDLNLLDFISLDYKAPKYKFEQITHTSISSFDKFKQTLSYLIKINFDYEVRTTVHADLINEDDINYIINDLVTEKYKGQYFLQNFLETEENIGNLESSIKKLNLEKIQDKNGSIDIQYRNY